MSPTELEAHSQGALDDIHQNDLDENSSEPHSRLSHSKVMDQEKDSSSLREPPLTKDAGLAELSKSQDPIAKTIDEEKASAGDSTDDKKPFSVRLTAFLQFSSLCWTLFLAGWNDGTTGPLLPRMQTNYHVCIHWRREVFIFS
jgi:hypothetical protein